MTKPVVVTCSHGFMEKGFPSLDAAEQWIDDFARARRHDPRLCDGEHTVKEANDVSQEPDRGLRGEGPGAKS